MPSAARVPSLQHWLEQVEEKVPSAARVPPLGQAIGVVLPGMVGTGPSASRRRRRRRTAAGAEEKQPPLARQREEQKLADAGEGGGATGAG